MPIAVLSVLIMSDFGVDDFDHRLPETRKQRQVVTRDRQKLNKTQGNNGFTNEMRSNYRIVTASQIERVGLDGGGISKKIVPAALLITANFNRKNADTINIFGGNSPNILSILKKPIEEVDDSLYPGFYPIAINHQSNDWDWQHGSVNFFGSKLSSKYFKGNWQEMRSVSPKVIPKFLLDKGNNHDFLRGKGLRKYSTYPMSTLAFFSIPFAANSYDFLPTSNVKFGLKDSLTPVRMVKENLSDDFIKKGRQRDKDALIKGKIKVLLEQNNPSVKAKKYFPVVDNNFTIGDSKLAGRLNIKKEQYINIAGPRYKLFYSIDQVILDDFISGEYAPVKLNSDKKTAKYNNRYVTGLDTAGYSHKKSSSASNSLIFGLSLLLLMAGIIILAFSNKKRKKNTIVLFKLKDDIRDDLDKDIEEIFFENELAIEVGVPS
jgi:hypothetical protein